jgi:hypothetical protein
LPHFPAVRQAAVIGAESPATFIAMPDCTRLLNASTASGDNDLFAGLDAELKKIAALLDVNEKTVRRHRELAKIRIYRTIEKKTEMPCPFSPPLHACLPIMTPLARDLFAQARERPAADRDAFENTAHWRGLKPESNHDG